MVLMRQGRAKQRHDAVAHDLVHRALIAMHGLHHAFQHGIEELPGLLRVTVGEEFHGALEVGKQHGDLLALAFEGAAGGENLLGEIGGGVGERRLRRCRRWRGDGGRSGACIAGPYEDTAVLIQCQALAVNEFVLESLQVCLVELELELQGAIGQAAASLEHGDGLIQYLFKGHRFPFLCCGAPRTTAPGPYRSIAAPALGSSPFLRTGRTVDS